MPWTYLFFHLVFILPVIGVLGLLCSRRPHGLVHPALGVASMAMIALLYTTPWDNYLVYRGVWSYGPGTVLEKEIIGYIPLEEYLFFILQPIMSGLFLIFYLSRNPAERAELQHFSERSTTPRAAGIALAMAACLLAIYALTCLPEVFLYAGLIVVWATPVVAFHWAFAGDLLWQTRRVLRQAVIGPTIYLWVADRLAIGWNIWAISPRYSLGWTLLGLPWEEALFFALTNLLVVQGLLIYFWLAYRWQAGELGSALVLRPLR